MSLGITVILIRPENNQTIELIDDFFSKISVDSLEVGRVYIST